MLPGRGEQGSWDVESVERKEGWMDGALRSR